MKNNSLIKIMKLFDVCNPKQWKTISTKDLTESGYPLYGANGKIGFYSIYNHEDPTLLITCRGATCGSLIISESKSYINGNAMSLDNLSDDVDIKYLYYFLFQRGFKDSISGSAQPQITRQGLQKIQISLPPLEEQKRIVKILDEADGLRQKRKQAIALLDDYLKSVFLETFGDPMTNSKYSKKVFKKYVKRVTYGFTSPMQHLFSGIPILTAKNIKNGSIDFSTADFADTSEYDALTSKCKPKKFDILVTKDGTMGRTAIVNVDYPICINQSVALIEPDLQNVNPVYLMCYLNFPSVQNTIQKMGKGNAIKHLQITELAKFPIGDAPRVIQDQFALIFNKTESLKQAMLIQSAKLETQFQALIQKAFKGEL